MPSCVVKWCRSHSDMTKSGITFHQFPVNEIIREKWMAAVRLERNESDWRPSRCSKICSIHFRSEDIYMLNTGKDRKRLRKTAVPICTMVTPFHSNTEPASRQSFINHETYKNVQKEYSSPPKQATSIGAKCEQDGTPGIHHNLLIGDQDDAELNSDDDLSEDESRATFVSQSQQVPVASTSAGGVGKWSHDTLRCDSCRCVVTGIRQVCVECEYTHCMSCEARGAHAHHYMLRVPGPRPEELVQRIVKMIQKELADTIPDAQPAVDPNVGLEIIKSEIKTEPEPDPLAEAVPTAVVQPRPSILEQAMLNIDIKEELDCADEVVDPSDEPPSSEAGDSSHIVAIHIPKRGESSSNKRRSSSASQATAAKKTFITVDAGSIGDVTIKTEPLTAEESLQTHHEVSCSGEYSVTSNQTETRSKQIETELTGRERKGTTAKKKVEQRCVFTVRSYK